MAKNPQTKNSKISEGMKAYHEKKKEEKKRAEEIERQLQQRVAAISTFRDPFKAQFLRISPAEIRGVLDSTRAGYLNDWSDFCDWMLDTDSLISALVKIRLLSVGGKDVLIQPGNQSDEAKAAADFVREQITKIPEFKINLRRLLMGVFKGVAITEILWDYDPITDTMFVKELLPVQTRKIKIRLNPENQEGIAVKTPATTGYGKWLYSYWNFGDNNYGEGIDVTDIFPGKFIIHSPGEESTPHDRGLFRPLAFNYFFKQSGLAYWAAGAEKTSTPILYAKIPRATPEDTRYNLATQLNNLASDSSAVFDADIEIDTIFPSTSGGDGVWKQFVDQQNGEITKVLIGGTLTVDAGSAGSYALGEVHERTREDIMQADAEALAETLCRDLIYHILDFNKHKFGGVVPPLPKLSFDISTRQSAPIDQMGIDIGAVTINEYRDSRGLPRWTDEEGGNKIAKYLPTDAGSAEAALSMESPQNFADASTHYAGKKKDLTLFLEPNDGMGDNVISASNKPELILYIEKDGDEYGVYSEDGKQLGSYKSKDQALQRLKQIEAFKHMDKN